MRWLLPFGILCFLGCSSVEDRSVVLMEQLARLFEAHQHDCDELGSAVSEFMVAHQELLSEMRKFDKVTQDRIMAKSGKRIDQARKRILDRMLDCTENVKLIDALNQLN